MIGRETETKRFRSRVTLFRFVLVGALSLIVLRLFHLQFVQGHTLRKYSEANRLKKGKLFPPRGIIFDRNGRVIVDNRASFDVVLIPQYYLFKPEMNRRLARLLGIALPTLEKKLKKARRGPAFYGTLLKADVSKDVIAAIEMDPRGFPGVNIEATVVRRYPHGELAAQLLGYVAEVSDRDIKRYPEKLLEPGDYIGRTGLERTYDSYLRGETGVEYVQVDVYGRRRAVEKGEELLGFVAQREPVPGNHLYLTLDLDIQQVAHQALADKGWSGAVVAMDPRSGEVLAMVSLPSYNPALISGRQVSSAPWNDLVNNKERPLRNRAIQDHYPPGSVFKAIVAIAALTEGVATPKTTVGCAGSIRFGRRRFHCWKRHGKIDFVRAIKESCDVFFYRMGLELGVDLIAKYSRLFGLGARTGIRLSNEQEGLIPDTKWKRKRFKDKWYAGETLSVAIGQGYVATTPIQMAVSFGAIGNQGFVYRPYIMNRIEGEGGEIISQFRPELIRKVEIPSEVFEVVKRGLWKVSNEKGGTAYWHRSKIVEMAGKTGTAQVRRFKNIKERKCEKMERKDRHHGWFVGYAPSDNPELVVAAIGEHNCHGSSVAPIVRDVINKYFKKKQEQYRQWEEKKKLAGSERGEEPRLPAADGKMP